MSSSLVGIDTSIFSDFVEFENVNNDWSIEKHLNFNYDIDAAILFSRLYFPEFIEVKNCILLKERYNVDNFEGWFDELKGDIREVEKISNLYEIKDLFHINDDSITSEKLLLLGDILKRVWKINLDLLFPSKKVDVYVFKEGEDIYITLYT